MALLACVAVAAAQELLTPGEQVLRELDAALAASDDDLAARLLAEAGELYRFPASPAEAQALLDALGGASRSKRGAVVVAALDALAATGAPGARTYVEPHLRTVRRGEEPIVLAAVRAAGQLRAPALIPALLDLARQGNDLTIAEQALLALGEYRDAGSEVRGRVLKEVLATCQTLEKRRDRWNRLRAPGLRALQMLSGRRMNSVAMFADWWRFAKARKDPWAE